LGGQELSGVGFGLGVDRALLAAQAEGVLPEFSRVDVIGVPLGETARARLVAIAGELRAAGIRTDLVYGGRSMKAGFKAADRSGAKLALVLGERDLEAGNIGVKTLATGDQVTVALADVVAAVQESLAAGTGAVRETP